MSTIHHLQKQVQSLREAMPDSLFAPTWSVDQELARIPEENREQARVFLHSIQDRVSFTESGFPLLSRLTDAELDQLAVWAGIAK